MQWNLNSGEFVFNRSLSIAYPSAGDSVSSLQLVRSMNAPFPLAPSWEIKKHKNFAMLMLKKYMKQWGELHGFQRHRRGLGVVVLWPWGKPGISCRAVMPLDKTRFVYLKSVSTPPAADLKERLTQEPRRGQWPAVCAEKVSLNTRKGRMIRKLRGTNTVKSSIGGAWKEYTNFASHCAISTGSLTPYTFWDQSSDEQPIPWAISTNGSNESHWRTTCSRVSWWCFLLRLQNLRYMPVNHWPTVNSLLSWTL